MQPTVLTDTTPDMQVVREEIFGPVVCAIPFGSEDDDVIQSGNDTNYGLASGIWTRGGVLSMAARLNPRRAVAFRLQHSAGVSDWPSTVNAITH